MAIAQLEAYETDWADLSEQSSVILQDSMQGLLQLLHMAGWTPDSRSNT